jgi:transcriptional regulator with XRE-family HTH domain
MRGRLLTPEEVGHRIQALREERGWKRSELAQRLDARPSQVQAWEEGRYRPKGEATHKLAALFGVEPDHFQWQQLDESAPSDPLAAALAQLDTAEVAIKNARRLLLKLVEPQQEGEPEQAPRSPPPQVPIVWDKSASSTQDAPAHPKRKRSGSR